ncbi:MAG: 2-oxo-4-hydroxy-4-carboxy-5-ureidoimidazoline decarboxylase [Deltaproteobacteria bacterium]|nr:2-oxo-4-hydroxy-4-carboxy-5-ureidoimidazoline decarboxylase [Deltaproteobacteria bacterium]
MSELDGLNTLTPDEAKVAFERCCGSKRWVDRMTASRPFPTPAALYEAADRIWGELSEDDFREAFTHHPKIGAKGLRDRWASNEQKGVHGASPETIEGLASGNTEYERKFGYIFLICATGKTADEMLALLRKRMNNDAHTEIRVAAAEQGQITRLRLEKLLRAEKI